MTSPNDEAWKALDSFAAQWVTHRHLFDTKWQQCPQCRDMAESTISLIEQYTTLPREEMDEYRINTLKDQLVERDEAIKRLGDVIIGWQTLADTRGRRSLELQKAVAKSWERMDGDFSICVHCGARDYGLYLHPEGHQSDCIVLTIPEALPKV